MQKPGTLDYVDLLILRCVKARRTKRSRDEIFYETFFTEKDVEKYIYDIRNVFRFRRISEAYRALFGDSPARVVDVGAGLGVVLRFLPDCADYMGVEYSAQSLEFARQLHAERKADFRQGGFPHLPAGSDWADLAICQEVIEHIPDDRQAIHELARIVRPGGHLILSVPSTHYWPDYLTLIGHYRHYTRAGLAALLDESGFDVVRGYSQFNGFWRLYHYLYLFLMLAEAVAKKLGFRYFSILSTGLYRSLASAIDRYLTARDLPDDPRSTFVLCRRRAAEDR